MGEGRGGQHRKTGMNVFFFMLYFFGCGRGPNRVEECEIRDGKTIVRLQFSRTTLHGLLFICDSLMSGSSNLYFLMSR